MSNHVPDARSTAIIRLLLQCQMDELRLPGGGADIEELVEAYRLVAAQVAVLHTTEASELLS